MLSIIIPTFNYNTVSLVDEIKEQCNLEFIDYEIIVLDDGSTNREILNMNESINQIPHCKFEKNRINLGRGKNINKLISLSRYNWLLLLDCDVLPTQKTFIQNYINCIKSNKKISFGGIAYKKEKPQKEKLLRWVYGKKREELSIDKRKLNPYQTTLTSNILIHKSVFEKVQFDERITEYGYEDLVFTEQLRNIKFPINHLENPVYHLNYETSKIFLEKTKIGLSNLVELETKRIIQPNVTKIQKYHSLLLNFKIRGIFLFFFKFFEKVIKANLVSKRPILFLFDIYKLGTFTNFCK